ncbi:MAG: SDR family oxidoreductase [Gammaproteobacteria bacterium]|jgi:NAD(P)-dependent dehydrogenase (short-subunit alcohol dehydrogenase family)|nr:SDR family oxidoreductase [Gammaproteobacteria bacterium]MBT7369465.1 SDR family oxidoreductase [Gammaproteobacteria bacterium]
MAEQTFANMKAVVSGATGTIGKAVAQRIVTEGGSVIILGRNEGTLQEIVAEIGGDATYRVLDIDDDGAVEAFAQSLDRLDILVTTAGWTVMGPVDEVPVADAMDMFGARFFGQCRLIKSCLPKFDDGGIILMCSGVGNTSFYPRYAYGSAVAGAIEAFAHHIAGELAPRKIRVNVVSPGWTVPEEFDPDRIRSNRGFNNEQQQAEFFAALDSPMHETIAAEEFADALVFCARSRHYTGQVIRLDAGRSVTDKPIDGAVDPMTFAYQS